MFLEVPGPSMVRKATSNLRWVPRSPLTCKCVTGRHGRLVGVRKPHVIEAVLNHQSGSKAGAAASDRSIIQPRSAQLALMGLACRGPVEGRQKIVAFAGRGGWSAIITRDAPPGYENHHVWTLRN